MKAKLVRTGDTLVLNGKVYVVVSVEPDEDVMTLNVAELHAPEQMFFHPKETVPQPIPTVDPDAISAEFATKLYDKVALAQKQYGTEWTGACGTPLDCMEEELLDAFVYLWVHRQIIAQSVQAVQVKGE